MDDELQKLPTFYGHTVKFAIGDYYNDGHGLYKAFIVRCTHPVEYLEELRVRCKKELNIDIQELVSEYQDCSLKPREIDALVKAGIDIGFVEYDIERRDEAKFGGGVEYYAQSCNGLLRLWLDCLNLVDPTVDFEIIFDDIPVVTGPGYGLFFS
jgi:hypothetical protein